MGNCNGLPSPCDDDHPGLSGGPPTVTCDGIDPLPSPKPASEPPSPAAGPAGAPPQPEEAAPPRLRPSLFSNIGRVLGRPMEDVRSIYEFRQELGRGQFGVTHLVTHKVTGEIFACKSIATRKLVARDDVEDVRREVQIMHHLTGHRNIVELKGAYEDRSSVNLVMELCTDGELFDRLIAKGPCRLFLMCKEELV